MDLWLVGKYCGVDNWEFVGVFDSAARADEVALAERESDLFVARIRVNDVAPAERCHFPDSDYPKYRTSVHAPSNQTETAKP